MKIVIAAGGTGGHIYPGIALAEEIRGREAANEILFIGSYDGLEKELVRRAGFDIKLIRSRALLRKISYKAFSAPFLMVIGFCQAIFLLSDFQPALIISTGGYASLPVVLAAKLLAIPVYLHEQNVLPGVTNRLLSRLAKKVFLSFERSRQYLPGAVTGNPVRAEILTADRQQARQKLGYQPTDKVVLVMGGSQGARTINEAVTAAWPQLLTQPNLRLIHLVGQHHPIKYPGQIAYLYNVADHLAAADLVISRAGASAIAEFLVRGLPMILVPFPFSAENHQELNAQVVAEAGAAIMVKNSDFTAAKVVELLTTTMLDLPKMSAYCEKLARPAAAEEIINALA